MGEKVLPVLYDDCSPVMGLVWDSDISHMSVFLLRRMLRVVYFSSAISVSYRRFPQPSVVTCDHHYDHQDDHQMTTNAMLEALKNVTTIGSRD